MAICTRTQCEYYKDGCSVNLYPEHPECPLRNEKQNQFVCAACDFCGQPAIERMEINFMCLLSMPEEEKVETTCYCVCGDCKAKYQDVVDSFKERLEGLKLA